MKLLVLFLTFFSLQSFAAVQTKTVEYKKGDKIFEGFAAWPEGAEKEKLPGVLVVHDWMGLTDKTKQKATELAEMGYVAFAVDVFGKDVRPKTVPDAQKNAMIYYGDRKMLRERVNLGLNELKNQLGVDKKKLAAIGFCFGGTSVIELARSGADVKGVVSFHGGLDSPTPADGKKIKGKVLALHGADDPHVSASNIAAFEQEMRDGKVDWLLVKYGGAVHSFTDKTAGTDNSKGAAYNEKADRRSKEEMKRFFAELF